MPRKSGPSSKSAASIQAKGALAEHQRDNAGKLQAVAKAAFRLCMHWEVRDEQRLVSSPRATPVGIT